MSEIHHHAVLDVLGEESPIPVIRTKEKLDELNAGEILKVLTTKQSAVDNIQTLVFNNPYTLLKQDKQQNQFILFIQKQ
jgi:tRNA 2-thiouridine synthesizing protein A